MHGGTKVDIRPYWLFRLGIRFANPLIGRVERELFRKDREELKELIHRSYPSRVDARRMLRQCLEDRIVYHESLDRIMSLHRRYSVSEVRIRPDDGNLDGFVLIAPASIEPVFVAVYNREWKLRRHLEAMGIPATRYLSRFFTRVSVV